MNVLHVLQIHQQRSHGLTHIDTTKTHHHVRQKHIIKLSTATTEINGANDDCYHSNGDRCLSLFLSYHRSHHLYISILGEFLTNAKNIIVTMSGTFTKRHHSQWYLFFECVSFSLVSVSFDSFCRYRCEKIYKSWWPVGGCVSKLNTCHLLQFIIHHLS